MELYHPKLPTANVYVDTMLFGINGYIWGQIGPVVNHWQKTGLIGGYCPEKRRRGKAWDILLKLHQPQAEFFHLVGRTMDQWLLGLHVAVDFPCATATAAQRLGEYGRRSLLALFRNPLRATRVYEHIKYTSYEYDPSGIADYWDKPNRHCGLPYCWHLEIRLHTRRKLAAIGVNGVQHILNLDLPALVRRTWKLVTWDAQHLDELILNRLAAEWPHRSSHFLNSILTRTKYRIAQLIGDPEIHSASVARAISAAYGFRPDRIFSPVSLVIERNSAKLRTPTT
jgi:hypothetical protein